MEAERRSGIIRDAMTVLEETLPPVGEPFGEPADEPADEPTTLATSRPRVLPRLIVGFVLGFALAIGLVVAGIYAYDATYAGRVVPGVHAAGVDLAGMDRDHASAAISAALAGYGQGKV